MTVSPPPAVVYHSTVPANAPEGHYIRLSTRDSEAFNTFAPVTVGYYFETFIDPSSLVRSLSVILERFPGYTGRIVTLDDTKTYYIKPWVHPPSISAVEVSKAMLTDPNQWGKIAEWYPLRPNFIAGNRLFHAVLAHTSSQADGCTLLVSMDHVLADATTCSFFLWDWSQQHRAMYGVSKRVVEMTMATTTQRIEGDLTVKRFYFHSQTFSGLKAAINRSGPANCQVTVNDILLAMCSCAVASKAPPVGTHARLALMVDPRGRGVDVNFMGNAAMPMNIWLEWAVLTCHDLPTIARAVRRSVLEGLETVRTTCKLEPNNYATEEALLQWNSWARAKGLVDANFGQPLKKFEWVNLQNLVESKVFIVVPVTSTGGLALQVALPHDIMEYLDSIWKTFSSLKPAA